MLERCWEITLELETCAPLHVGLGEPLREDEVPIELWVEDEEREKKPPEVAAIIRDHEDKPWIPPTTVKGLLRAAAEKAGLDPKGGYLVHLFGQISEKGSESGWMGRAIPYGMEMVAKPEPTANAMLPWYEAHSGSYISAHTSIDATTGAVAEHKLYHREMVAPGARFRLRLKFMPFCDDEGKYLNLLGRLLGAFNSEDGVRLGRGKQDANGRMKAVGEPRLKLCVLSPAGDLEEQQAPELVQAFQEGWANQVSTRETVWRLKLTPDAWSGPFLVIDSSVSVKNEKKRDSDEEEANTIRPLCRNDATPHLPGESFMGALRARAEWMAELQVLRNEMDEEAKGKLIAHLFGHEAKPGGTGRRGRLALKRLEVTAQDKVAFPSVALDRFSMAPLGSALFKVEGFTGVEITAVLALEESGGEKTAAIAAKEFMEALIADLKENGLTLGHGEARGFGWFEVKHNV